MSADTDGRAPLPLLGRLGAFLELGKVKIVELWIGFFVALSLLRKGAASEPREQLLLLITLVSMVVVAALTCSLDDIAGARDGVDRANHLGESRWGVDKPILTGRLSERRALAFARVLGALALLGYAAVVALAWPLPPWVILTTTGVALLAVNYSYGLRLSYRGAGELVVLAAGAGTLLVPYGLVERAAPGGLVLCNAALIGAWQAQVVLCSNSLDAAGDRATGRWTLAARLSPLHNRVFVSAVFAVVWGYTAAALIAGVLPLALAFFLAPVWVMQGYQLWLGVFHGEWQKARRAGFRVVRLGAAALILANLILFE